jgi:UDP-N-acetylglucosamine 2-epimerase (non-hydrolysing)
MRVMIVLGTRPEAIKLAPLILKLKSDPFFEVYVVSTGQHREMLDPILKFFSIAPDHDMDIMKPGQSLNDLFVKALSGVKAQGLIFKPDVIVVQGDTVTAMAASVAGFFEKVKIAHVEAGLRTGDLSSPWPEEFNRRVTAVAADLHFAPTQENKVHLMKENILEKNIFVVGNTGVDALKIVSDRLDQEKDLFNNFKLSSTSQKILVTVHRRENFGAPLENIFHAIKEILQTEKNVEIIWPLHKNPEVLKCFSKIFGELKYENLFLTEPLDYVPFIKMMKISDLILSDSGGVQEEAPFLGKPILVLRNTTERQESIESGNCELVGSDTKLIVRRTKDLLKKSTDYQRMSKISFPYGDGTASHQILNVFKKM